MKSNKTSKYNAEHEQIEPPLFCKLEGKVTRQRLIASIINSSWIYSDHWTPENWVDQAKKDVATRIDYASEDLYKLKYAQEMLLDIDD